MQYDYLTGILDRKSIEDLAKERIASNKSFSLGLLDLDNFKLVNDKYGHQYGDVVLKRTATAISTYLGNNGYVGRIGGDEFIFIIDEVSELSIRHICSIIREKISVASDKEDVMVSASIGILSYPKDAKDYDTIIKKADKALYIAKKKGKNRYIIYNEEKHGENVVINSTLSCANDRYSEAVMLADVINNLYSNDINLETRIKMAIKQMCVHYAFDRVVIYFNDFKKPYTYVGNVPIVLDGSYVLEEMYKKLFNERNIYVIENIPFLNLINKDLHNIYFERGIKALIQYKMEINGQMVGLISFEMTNSPRSLKDSEVINISAIAICITNILTKK